MSKEAFLPRSRVRMASGKCAGQSGVVIKKSMPGWIAVLFDGEKYPNFVEESEIEYDSGLSREEAEKQALIEIEARKK